VTTKANIYKSGFLLRSMANSSDSKENAIVKATTEELNEFLTPYLGRKTWGNLRKDKQFPQIREDFADWVVMYETKGASSLYSGLVYDIKTNKWGKRTDPIRGSSDRRTLQLVNPYLSKEQAVESFKAKIMLIPNLREANINLYYKQFLAGICTNGKSLEELFSPSELQLLRRLEHQQSPNQ
jgi:hypothetical protein